MQVPQSLIIHQLKEKGHDGKQGGHTCPDRYGDFPFVFTTHLSVNPNKYVQTEEVRHLKVSKCIFVIVCSLGAVRGNNIHNSM
jgi:hypothetical protein